MIEGNEFSNETTVNKKKKKKTAEKKGKERNNIQVIVFTKPSGRDWRNKKLNVNFAAASKSTGAEIKSRKLLRSGQSRCVSLTVEFNLWYTHLNKERNEIVSAATAKHSLRIKRKTQNLGKCCPLNESLPPLCVHSKNGSTVRRLLNRAFFRRNYSGCHCDWIVHCAIACASRTTNRFLRFTAFGPTCAREWQKKNHEKLLQLFTFTV